MRARGTNRFGTALRLLLALFALAAGQSVAARAEVAAPRAAVVRAIRGPAAEAEARFEVRGSGFEVRAAALAPVVTLAPSEAALSRVPRYLLNCALLH